MRVTARALYAASLTFAVLLAAITTMYWVSTPSGRHGDMSGLEVYGYCSLANDSLVCAGSIVNSESSIIPVDNISLSTQEYRGLVRLYPYMIVKEDSTTWFLFYLNRNGSYIFYSTDGVTSMVWKGHTDLFKPVSLNPVRVFRETHGSSRTSGLIPIELNDYKFLSNSSTGYYGVLEFNRSVPAEYVDVKLMVLHDRLAWEEAETNVSKKVFIIPFQTLLYEAERGSLLGYPSRVTVEYQSKTEANTSVSLIVYKTKSVSLSIEWGGIAHNDILPILPPHLAASLFRTLPYFLYSSPVLQTAVAPTR